MREFTEQELVRREKLNILKEKNVDPFGQKYEISTTSSEIKENYEELTKEELHEKNIFVSIAGRIMTKRGKGKVGFFHVQDKTGQIQIYIRKDEVSESEFEIFDSSDLGDIVGIEGHVMKTNMGELSIHATKFTHLVKALRPLPDKFHGLASVEERYRRRYVDLIVNEDARRVATLRPKIIRSIQNYLDNLGYIEVETPILQATLGGAAARPFVTHHNTLDMDFNLRIATELPLKRLLVGGLDAVYEIGRLFRNEGMDKNHNPEFTTIELYKAYSDLEGMMDITEGIIGHVAHTVLGTYDINWRGHDISLKPNFKRVHMVDLIKEKTGVNFFDVTTLEEANKLADEHGVEVEDHYLYGHIVNAFFEKFGEETIIEPTFVFGHPVEISPLAKKDLNDERFTQRFELFIVGGEYANAFTELNDPIDQYERFLSQLKEKELGNDEANDMDMDYVEALEYGMPPAGGMGMGIDRLVMMITNSETIREVILFPHMKNKN
ncbi:MAG: lysine--tRNA ligase [bacterium]